MSSKKDNYYSLTKNDFIRYLYQEGQRKGVHKHPDFYSEILKFVASEDGQKSFAKFRQLNPSSVGITAINAHQILKRAF
jgi:hypothetical protein